MHLIYTKLKSALNPRKDSSTSVDSKVIYKQGAIWTLSYFLHLTFMSLEEESVVVMDTHIKLAIAKYGNAYLTKHKPHETSPTPLDVFLHKMT